jgi:hypothetical protein
MHRRLETGLHFSILTSLFLRRFYFDIPHVFRHPFTYCNFAAPDNIYHSNLESPVFLPWPALV